MQILKVTAADKIRRTCLDDFPDVLRHWRQTHPDVHLPDIPILLIPPRLWDKFHFQGEGYNIDFQRDLAAHQRQLDLMARNPSLYQSLPTTTHQRDVNLYRLYRQLGANNFLVLRNDAGVDYYLLHELAHDVYRQNPSSVAPIRFGEEYLDDPAEQFAHRQEMRFAQSRGLTFERWFEQTKPNETRLIREYENGWPRNKQLYDLASADRRDFQRLWEAALA
jgi:hypothetical protein